jgi:hypothetical protein
MKKGLIYLIIVILLAGCSRYSPEIENVLQQAGKNRSQLEKVLKHYSRNPADSLKLRAAEFLTVNMPGKCSVEYEVPFENLIAFCMRLHGIDNRQSVDEAYGLIEPIIKEDVKYITGDYLINNIDLAFKVWEEQPWGKNVPFDIFCEEILPYRVANEPLENWREKVLSGFSRLNRSFKTQPDITVVGACIQVNSQLPRFRITNGMPEMNYSMIMSTTKGTCEEMTALALFSMRALGIPVTQDCTPKWAGRNVGHIWNSVYDGAGKHISFMGAEFNPGINHQGIYMPKSKVYRQTFAIRKNIDANTVDIPPSLRNMCINDITDEYITLPVSVEGQSNGVEIPVKYPPATNTGYAYLAAIGEQTWNITGWGKADSATICYGTIGVNVLHLPLWYANDEQTPANYPFLIDSEGDIKIFEPDTGNYRQLSISEIFPSNNKFAASMENGFFEGANRSDFSDAKRLCTVQKITGAYFYTAKVQNPARYRYIRYVSPEKNICNVAEIKLYNAQGEKLRGKSICMTDTSNISNVTCKNAFDGDISTFYIAKYEYDWTGLDLGEAKTVAQIHYLPRNDGNNIYEEHSYELLYWNNNRWQYLEKQTAVNHILHFRVPANALFYIKNITTNKPGRWFVLNTNGEQWWM